MTSGRSKVLLAAAGWTLYVWISRLLILWTGDESLSFKTVHTVLATVSIGFAVAIAWIGWDALRARRAFRRGDHQEPAPHVRAG